MHTVQRLEQLLQWARYLGYQVRHEYLGGTGGGCCRVGGRHLLFVDLALSTHEQLERAVEALREEHPWESVDVPADLQPLWGRRKAA